MRVTVLPLLILGIAAVALTARTNQADIRHQLKAGRFSGYGTDTVFVYGPTRFTDDIGGTSYEDFTDTFNADTVLGWRYYIKVTTGSPAVSGCAVYACDEQFIGPQDFSNGVVRAIDREDPGVGSNNLLVSVKGAVGRYVDVTIFRVKDPTFTVAGRTVYMRLNPIGTETDTFSLPAGAVSPFVMDMINSQPGNTHKATNTTVKINGAQVLGTSDFGLTEGSKSLNVSLLAHDTLSILNQGGYQSAFTLRFSATDTTPPSINVTYPPESLVTALSQVIVGATVTDETSGLIKIDGRPWHLPLAGAYTDTLFMPSDGHYTVHVHAENSAKKVAEVVRHVTRDTQAPTLTIRTLPVDTLSSTLPIAGGWEDTSKTTVTIDGDTVGIGYRDSIRFNYPLDLGSNRILFRAIDALGHQTSFTRFVFRDAAGEPTARDSSNLSVATLSETGRTPFLESVSFLYSAGSPVQVGVVTSSLDTARAAVVRGRVVGRDWTAIANDTVQVLLHPEYGRTLTRNDGRFDLVVNGGGPLTLRFTKPGYLEVQRRVNPPPQEFFDLSDVAIIGKSSRLSVADSAATLVARGRFASDANGDRDARLVFPRGIVAKVAKSTGDTVNITTMHVRITEYTIGQDGPKAMPANLPPSSAYTYCIDARLNEADSISQLSGSLPLNTTLTKPIPIYVRNFLHTPVGTPVPVGYYDEQAAVWKAMKDGVVAKIVALSPGGTSDSIDTRGTGHGDPQSRLDSLGVTPEELVALRSQYAVGDTLWRISTTHFTSIDINYNESGFLAALGAGFLKLLKQLALIAKQCLFPGSIIECENRILGERFPIAGTPFTINYRSFRAPGDAAIRTLRVPIIGAAVPGGLTRVFVRLDVAGKHYEQIVLPPYSLSTPPVSIVWDGLDAYGRRIQGSVPGRVSVGYEFGGGLLVAGGGGYSLGDAASNGSSLGAPTGDRSLGLTVWSRQTVSLGAPSTASDGLGGWTISPHHVLDNAGDMAVYLGNGSVMLGDQLQPTVHLYMGGGCEFANKSAALPNTAVNTAAITMGPDGSLYIADNCRGAILRVTPAGQVTTVAGQSSPGNYAGDGSATSTPLRDFTGIAFAPDGAIYFTSNVGSDLSKCMLGRVANGTIKKIIGVGADTHNGSGDGGPVEQATTTTPLGVAVGADGSVFVAEGDDHRIRRIAPNGIINTYAGTGSSSSSSTDSLGKAKTIRLGDVASLATDMDGNLYVCEAEQLKIMKITPDGMLTRFATAGTEFKPYGMAFGPDGAAFVSCAVGAAPSNPTTTHRIWRRDVDSTLSVIAGGGLAQGDGVLASDAALVNPRGVAVAADGSYYVTTNGLITLISRTLGSRSATEIAIPSPDGSEVFYFSSVSSASGRHLRTRDALTGAVRYSFGYDAGGRLATIRDVSGLTTTIQRDGNGMPTGIAGPFGHRTKLAVDGNGYLQSIADTLNQTLAFTTRSDGLLSTFTDAASNQHSFDWETDGRLKKDWEPAAAGGYQKLDYTDGGLTRTVTRTTAEGRVATYSTTNLNNGTVQRRVTGYDGLLTFASDSSNASAKLWLPDGSSSADTLRPDPRFSMTVPVPKGSTARMPSGLALNTRIARTMDAGFNPPFTKGMWRQDVTVNGRAPLRTEFHADSLILRTASPVGRTTMTTVDTAGHPLTVTIPGLASISYGYDSQGRVTHIQQSGRPVRLHYDSRGRLDTVTDTLNRVTTFAYDLADRETLRTLPDGRELHFGYDANSNLVRLTPPGRSAHEFGYTAIDLPETYTPPSLGAGSTTTSYTYNKDQQLKRYIGPDGVAASLAYDGTRARLDSLTTARGRITYFYKGSGNVSELDSLSSPDTVTVHYAYDGPLVTSESWTGKIAGSAAVTYDSDFRVATQSVNSANSVSYGYDADGLLVTAGAESVHRLSANGLIDSTAVANLSSTQDYSDLGELANLHYSASGTGIYLENLARDAIGRITAQSEKVGSTTTTHGYRYDAAGRLYAVTTGSDTTAKYLYDTNGNRLSFTNPFTGDTASATYDGQDRLLRYKNSAYSYTSNGELKQKVSGTDTTRYTYDALGNLVTVILPNHDRIDYVIDGQNRRVGRKVNSHSLTGWLYQNSLNPVAELDSTGAVTARYVWGTRGNVPDYVIKSATTYRIVSDHLGSVRLVVNASSGAVAESVAYDAYGKRVADTSPGFVSLGYAGGISDAGTGLVRFGARDFDPEIGRWTCKDPIGFAGGDASLMVYAAGDPINLIDPTGADADDDLDAIAGWADGVSCGQASKIREKYFSYNSINKKSNLYKQGQGQGRAILQQLVLMAAGGAVVGLLENASIGTVSIFGTGSLGAAEARALQTGSGQITSATAKALNKASGEILSRREWGRVVEALKKNMLVPGNSHGTIMSTGDYLDAAGKSIGHLFDYLP